MWCWAADRKENIWWAPFLLPAIAPVAKPLYAGVHHPRTRVRVAPAQQETATPANLLILRASGSSSSPWRGVPHPGPKSASVSHTDIGYPADLGRCTRECGFWAACPKLLPATRPPPHRKVSLLPAHPGTRSHHRSPHPPLRFGPSNPNRGPRRSSPELTATSSETRLPLGCPLPPDVPDLRSSFPANTTASSAPRYLALQRGAS